MGLIQGFKDECGVFGIWGHPDAAYITYLGLHGLQHRGQESAGITVSDGESFRVHRGMGYVADVFNKSRIEELKGNSAIGHVRYSTQGDSSLKNAQPVVVSCWRGPLALSHNGNIVNAVSLRRDLERNGSIFQTTNDSEVILHLIAKAPESFLEHSVVSALGKISGGFSLVMLSKDSMIGIRDSFGFRPLVLAEFQGALLLASETCALDLIGAKFIREIDPGEILVINKKGLKSFYLEPVQRKAFCIFELIYFARPDSIIAGQTVYDVRKKLGKNLALEHPVDADVVIPVPDSGIESALGAAEIYKIPFEMGLIRNHYVGRTFIEPKQSTRDFGVKLKINPVRSLLENRRVVIIDDSIVRGTTSRKLVRMIRSVNAKEVHIRISSPPTVGSCKYGIDTPTEDELIGAQKNVEEIRDYIGADSLGYLSDKGLLDAVGKSSDDFCRACFNRNYPIDINPHCFR